VIAGNAIRLAATANDKVGAPTVGIATTPAIPTKNANSLVVMMFYDVARAEAANFFRRRRQQ